MGLGGSSGRGRLEGSFVFILKSPSIEEGRAGLGGADGVASVRFGGSGGACFSVSSAFFIGGGGGGNTRSSMAGGGGGNSRSSMPGGWGGNASPFSSKRGYVGPICVKGSSLVLTAISIGVQTGDADVTFCFASFACGAVPLETLVAVPIIGFAAKETEALDGV